ncbi:MAG: hypothetical protein WCP91_02715 [Candidatus Berkelbacteria bacterium]
MRSIVAFYIEVDGSETMLAALLPLGCKASGESNFSVVDNRAVCKMDCPSCQLAQPLELVTLEELQPRHGLQFTQTLPTVRWAGAEAGLESRQKAAQIVRQSQSPP